MSEASIPRLEEIDLSDRAFWLRPLEEREAAFATLRREAPIRFFAEQPIANLPLPTGPGYWALTRHADILEASKHPEIFSSAKGATSIQDLPEEFNRFFGGLINMDDPRHGEQRRIVSRGFTPRALERLEASVARRADAVIDRVIERGECDFVQDIAAPLPLEIICDLMGIPESHERMVFERSNVILGLGDTELVPDAANIIQAAMGAGAELAQLMNEMAEARRREPRDDLTSALLNAELEGGALSGDDLTSFFVLLVVAGNETTRNAISHGMKALCDFPDERRRWASDFERHAGTAVEEIVRWSTPVIHMRRTCTRDTVLSQEMKAGDKVVLWYASANRDEAVFDDPDAFRVDRNPNPHLAFGIGEHFCLGAHLARKTSGAIFGELVPRLELVEAAAPAERVPSNLVPGLKHLPIRYRLRPGR